MIDSEEELEQSEDESCVNALSSGTSVGPPEAPECHEQKKEEAPHREVHTPPGKLPVKLLTRLGSLESPYQFIRCISKSFLDLSRIVLVLSSNETKLVTIIVSFFALIR